jgi:hypothetical protein
MFASIFSIHTLAKKDGRSNSKEKLFTEPGRAAGPFPAINQPAA